MNRIFLGYLLFASLAGGVSASASAAPISFTLDPSLSNLSISVVSFLGAVEPQGPGAWAASYSGTIDADVEAATIQILGTSVITAGISGDWMPGTDYSDYQQGPPATGEYRTTALPANYGSTATLFDDRVSNNAVRDVQFSLSDAAPKPLTLGVFSEEGITPSYLAGTVYYDEGLAPPITDLTDTAGVSISPFVDVIGTGTLTQNGNLLTLSIPVEFSSSFFLSTTTYSGTIVATALVPEPGSAALLLTAIPVLALAVRRVRRLQG